MRLRNYLAVGCLALLGLSAQAETLSGLYQVREPVDGQGAEARTQATGKALETLVLRLTGDPKAAQSPALAGLRKDPQQIISQFGFEAGPPETVLVDFDPGSTERTLRQAGLALWGNNRPSILGWWLNDSTEGSSLVGDGQNSAAPLRRAAQHRGLPLRLPLADLNEQLVATAKNLEGADPARCARLPSVMAPTPCWRCMPVKPTANGRAPGACGWASSASRARLKLPTRPRWPTP